MSPMSTYRRARAGFVLLGLCAAVLAARPAIAPASSGLPGANGKLAFHSDAAGPPGSPREIFTMSGNGAGQTNVSNNAANDRFPAWSPDGTKIAFASTRATGAFQIYVMNSDGSAQTRLTNNAAADAGSVWSPDGKRIAFQSNRDAPAVTEIYVMNADGSAQTRLTSNAAFDVNPAWSPDGTRIAFESDRDGNREIYVMNADGSGQTNISHHAADDSDPAWSPDGTRIAFASTRDDPGGEIYTMNPDGSAVTRLTNNAVMDADPAWSPDGSQIAFARKPFGLDWEIYVMNANGTAQTNLTLDPADDYSPSWQPLPNDLSVTPTVNPSTIKVDGQATFTFTAKNNGSAPAPGASLSTQPAGGGELVSVSSSVGPCVTGAMTACSVGTLGPGTSATVTVVERAIHPGAVSVVATVSAYGADSNAANNSAAATASAVRLRIKLPKGLREGTTKRIKGRALYRAIARGISGEAEGLEGGGGMTLEAQLTRKRGGKCQRLGTRRWISCSRTSVKGMTLDTSTSPAKFRYRPLRSRRRAARVLRNGAALRKGIYTLAIKAIPAVGNPVTFVFNMRVV